MRKITAPLQKHIVPLIQRLRAGLEWLIAGIFRVLRWANSLDLPLSHLQWILLFYVGFGTAYLLATPVFEANDEIWHFGVIRHLRAHWKLAGTGLRRQRHNLSRARQSASLVLRACGSTDIAPQHG